jgi:hypothetical protein
MIVEEGLKFERVFALGDVPPPVSAVSDCAETNHGSKGDDRRPRLRLRDCDLNTSQAQKLVEVLEQHFILAVKVLQLPHPIETKRRQEFSDVAGTAENTMSDIGVQ